MEYTIQQKPGYFEVAASGRTRPDDFTELCARLFEHAGWQPGTPVLFDFREMDFSLFDVNLIKETAEITRNNAPQWQTARLAVVLDSDLGLGLGNMWLSYSNDVQAEVKIFRDYPAAPAWVSEPPSTAAVG